MLAAAATPPEASSPASGSTASAIIFCLVFFACLLAHLQYTRRACSTCHRHVQNMPRSLSLDSRRQACPAPAGLRVRLRGSSAAVDGTIGPGKTGHTAVV